MEYQLGNKVVLTTTNRHEEFLTVVHYLLRNFPYSRQTSLDIKFLKKDGINFNANGDYHAVDVPEYNIYEGQIRVGYGQTGNDQSALNYLFHEYKHLLQDDAGYLYDPAQAHINHCIEAQAWADEQEPIYRKYQEAQNENRSG